MKPLAPNDNSKNQIYLGGDLGVVNIIPAGEPVAGSSGSHAEPIFKAPLVWSWLNDVGDVHLAPQTQLILYPQYPEVRLSGFLRGANWAPNALLTVRDPGRVLLIGITRDDTIIAYAAGPDSAVARELEAEPPTESDGVFRVVSLSPKETGDSRSRLLAALCDLHQRGWVEPWALQADGSRTECKGTNCIGVTLESELGIVGNGRSEPDFEGWEVKGHTVANIDRPGSGAITLMTPEPSLGYYVDAGVIPFVKRYGYLDKRGRENRMNFGGVHRIGIACASTGLTLTLVGYDAASETITRSDGMLALLDAKETVAAAWPFATLLAHWKRKHSRAAFVAGTQRKEPVRAYRYSKQVLLATGTDYLRLLAGLASGVVYYDPGIKVERLDARPTTKRRSQFRVKARDIARMYHSTSTTRSCGEPPGQPKALVEISPHPSK